MHRLLIADDHPLFRDAISRTLNLAVADGSTPEYELLQAASLEEALSVIAHHADSLDLLLLDLDHFKKVNDTLGLTTFVITHVQPIMTPGLLPMVIFLTMALLAFATASFWGLFAVAMPIVLPLAMSMDANMPLVVGALISASAFGSHACFYGDSTVLSAQGSGCSPMSHALTQLPYVLIAASISALIFLAAGYL